MENELWIARYENMYRETADKVLFDIQKRNWNPDYRILELFCKETYKKIVNMYSKFEKTREYVFTGDALSARNCRSGQSLAFCIGQGFTRSEISATHSIGWELQRLLDAQKTNPEPFDFKLLIVGYRRDEGDNGGQPSPTPLPVSKEIMKDKKSNRYQPSPVLEEVMAL